MPVLKAINGHGGCRLIEKYLEKNGRALARDLFNLSWDDRTMGNEDGPARDSVRWAAEMDALRHEEGNDLPYRGRQAITFRHYVLSPSPEDGLSLGQVQEIARAWVARHFADYQVAVVYHDDNASRIPHAHVVVNNTNLVTGKRLHIPDAKALNRDLQDMAEERGLRFMRDEPAEGSAPKGPRTRQAVYRNRAEERAKAERGYSWVEDVRSRVSVAKALAADEADFVRICAELELNVSDNSEHAARRDWIFSLVDQPTLKVSGERLGTVFGKTALSAHFARKAAYRPEAMTQEAAMGIAATAVELNDLADLDRLAGCLEACNRVNARSLVDLDRCIERAEARTPAANARTQERRDARLAELKEARTYAAEKGLLPHETEGPKRAKPSAAKDNAPLSRRQREEQRRRQVQQQQPRRQDVDRERGRTR